MGSTQARQFREAMISGPNDYLGETEALEDFDYGMREFAIYDNNGYLLQFGQSLQAD